ncbi:MAG: hypothetical protein JWN04_4858 [Myxococcaceae bacterium]|nr:hypothetical protein [Myxococcaceae bacterium]
MDSSDESEPVDRAPAHAFHPLSRLLYRVWADVNARIWESRSDDWAKVLRTFRSKRGNYYALRFGWFMTAIQTVLASSAVASGPDMQLIKLFREFNLSALARLSDAMQKGLSSSPIGWVHRVDFQSIEEAEVEAADLNGELTRFSRDLRSLVDRYPSLLERLRKAHSEALWNGLYDGDVADAEWSHLAYELRKHGFEPAEIAPLVDALPQSTALSDEPLRRRDLTTKARNRVRAQTDRTFARTGERKPSPGWGARGSRGDACTVLSVRACSDADDDDSERTDASGGSAGRVPLASRNS